MQPFSFFFFSWLFVGGDFGSGSGSKFNWGGGGGVGTCFQAKWREQRTLNSNKEQFRHKRVLHNAMVLKKTITVKVMCFKTKRTR